MMKLNDETQIPDHIRLENGCDKTLIKFLTLHTIIDLL